MEDTNTADKKVISGKLQLVVSYEDGGKQKNRSLSFSGVKADAEPAGLWSAANALAGLQKDHLDKVKETVQYEIVE